MRDLALFVGSVLLFTALWGPWFWLETMPSLSSVIDSVHSELQFRGLLFEDERHRARDVVLWVTLPLLTLLLVLSLGFGTLLLTRFP